MNGTQTFDALCQAAALDYAARGWHVFPAPAGEKKSHASAAFGNGERWSATTDPALIRKFWRQWPDANVGVACGPKSGLLVVECDTQEGHAVDGIASMQKLIAAHGSLPDTIEALSPSGSWHLYFKYPATLEIGNSASAIAPGVDVRGEGGMVIGVPSVKPGKTEPYRWKNPPGLFELADCPEWLLKLCTKKKEKVADETGFRFDAASSYSSAGTAEVEEVLSW